MSSILQANSARTASAMTVRFHFAVAALISSAALLLAMSATVSGAGTDEQPEA